MNDIKIAEEPNEVGLSRKRTSSEVSELSRNVGEARDAELVRTQRAVNWAVSIVNDNSHGYSQASRWGPDYDCSSLVIQAWENAGVPVKSRGATYTGNIVIRLQK